MPPFVRVTGDSALPLHAGESSAHDVDGDLDDDDGDIAAEHDADDDADPDVTAEPPSRAREGLPPSYRMRAEPHYVEAVLDRALAASEPVAAAPVTPAVAAAPPLPVAPDTAAGTQATPASLTVAATALADAFDAIQAALRDVPLRGRPLRDRVAIELARAEATRGRWLADAAVVLQVEPLPALDEVDLLRLLGQVFEALGPENRLSGGAAAMPVPPGSCPVFGDERLLTTALGAMFAGVRALIEDRGDARKVSVALGPRREAATRTIEVCQTAVRLPASVYPRFFDADWMEHPAGASGAMLLAAARKIARAHGGGLEVTALESGGSRLVLSLPAAD
ncbi:MAG: sensor histidine kinase [Acidobacteria bacterium]|nr:sensor histidine kinase [Acidobacteriota bacterium]